MFYILSDFLQKNNCMMLIYAMVAVFYLSKPVIIHSRRGKLFSSVIYQLKASDTIQFLWCCLSKPILTSTRGFRQVLEIVPLSSQQRRLSTMKRHVIPRGISQMWPLIDSSHYRSLSKPSMWRPKFEQFAIVIKGIIQSKVKLHCNKILCW